VATRAESPERGGGDPPLVTNGSGRGTAEGATPTAPIGNDGLAYVYLIRDGDGIPRYVGQGTGARWHQSMTIIKHRYGSAKAVIVQHSLDRPTAKRVEEELIETIGTLHCGNGPLENLMTLGTRSEKFIMPFTPSEIAEIDEWRYGNKVPSRSEAIRRLIALGLRASSEQAVSPPPPPAAGRFRPRRP
jgi:hypothetical protein